MKKVVVNSLFLSILLFLLIMSGIYFHTPQNRFIPVDPEVSISDRYYSYSSINGVYWCPPIYDEFNEKYDVKYYSLGVQLDLVDRMKKDVKKLGEDPDSFEKCIKALGILGSESPSIPCMAEKILFRYNVNMSYPDNYRYPEFEGYYDYSDIDYGPLETKPCWAIVCNWGAPGENYGHIKIYVVSIEDATIRYFDRCM
jgi:hypothetical protein